MIDQIVMCFCHETEFHCLFSADTDIAMTLVWKLFGISVILWLTWLILVTKVIISDLRHFKIRVYQWNRD